MWLLIGDSFWREEEWWNEYWVMLLSSIILTLLWQSAVTSKSIEWSCFTTFPCIALLYAYFYSFLSLSLLLHITNKWKIISCSPNGKDIFGFISEQLKVGCDVFIILPQTQIKQEIYMVHRLKFNRNSESDTKTRWFLARHRLLDVGFGYNWRI